MFKNLKTNVAKFVKDPEVKRVAATVAGAVATVAVVTVVSWAAYYAINGEEATKELWNKKMGITTDEPVEDETVAE